MSNEEQKEKIRTISDTQQENFFATKPLFYSYINKMPRNYLKAHEEKIKATDDESERLRTEVQLYNNATLKFQQSIQTNLNQIYTNIDSINKSIDDIKDDTGKEPSTEQPSVDSYFDQINEKFGLDSLWKNVKALKSAKGGNTGGPSLEGSQCTYTCKLR